MSMTVDELKAYFTNRELPEAIQINRSTRITDVKSFLETSFDLVARYGTSPQFGNAYLRLLALYDAIENPYVKD